MVKNIKKATSNSLQEKNQNDASGLNNNLQAELAIIEGWQQNKGQKIYQKVLNHANHLLWIATGLTWDDLPDCNSIWDHIFPYFPKTKDDIEYIGKLCASERIENSGMFSVNEMRRINKEFEKHS